MAVQSSSTQGCVCAGGVACRSVDAGGVACRVSYAGEWHVGCGMQGVACRGWHVGVWHAGGVFSPQRAEAACGSTLSWYLGKRRRSDLKAVQQECS